MDNEIELFAAAQNGDSKAIDTIFYKYKRCAESIAAQFTVYGFDYEDLQQTAYYGLCSAIRRYNPKTKVAFITYAYKTIYCSILKMLNENNPIHIPPRYYKLWQSLLQEQSRLYAIDGRFTSLTQCAENIGISQETAANLMNAYMPIVSLETEIQPPNEMNSDDFELADLIDDPEALQDIRNIDDKVTMEMFLSRIPAYWSYVLHLRYYENYTYEEIAQELGITRQCVQQVIRRAKTSLKRIIINTSQL